MEGSEKRLAELDRILINGTEKEINERIRLLRSEEPFRGALTLLALLYDKTGNQNIKLEITNLFNDMKEKSAMAEVIESLSAVSKQESRAMLVSSCWQSGLDYSEFALPLAEQFFSGDYTTSLECYTVLDTCAGSISDGDRIKIILRLQQQIESWETPKQKLAAELITLLKDLNA
jgi:hypothetical protein